MIVTALEEWHGKILVSLDGHPEFPLYKGEIKKFNIHEDMIIDDIYIEIMELLYKRARERALYILDKSYKTEKQMVDKLKQGFYPESIINKVLDYLKEYGFVDDSRYAAMYIEYKGSDASKKQILHDLYLKGISKENAELALEDSNYCEEKSLTKLIEKKISKYDLNNPKDLQKMYRYLLGKGYSYSMIKETVSGYSGANEY